MWKIIGDMTKWEHVNALVRVSETEGEWVKAKIRQKLQKWRWTKVREWKFVSELEKWKMKQQK